MRFRRILVVDMVEGTITYTSTYHSILARCFLAHWVMRSNWVARVEVRCFLAHWVMRFRWVARVKVGCFLAHWVVRSQRVAH